jgi:NADPH-dependent curcumin reductase
VVVAAASGGVGALVGQLAKKAGARAVGIAGGTQKCEFIKDELGFDAAIDHRSSQFEELLAKACPTGIDVYFENVGGEVLAATQFLRADANLRVGRSIRPTGSRWVGSAARSDASNSLEKYPHTRISNYGFRRAASGLRRRDNGLQDGTIRQREDVTVGFEQTIPAIIRMLEGRSFGKSVL